MKALKPMNRHQRLHDYVLDIYVHRTGEWLGPCEVTACNAKDAIREAKEQYAGRNVKAVVVICDDKQV